MRAGGGTVQEALTAEAASVVKQAETLARRRGHAQVTPLHVANTMLAASSGILRTACLQSHSHPLQCKALELCFNVALNRLPASTASPILGTHYLQYPSISNALVAAFKRAQAHQRRGSIENQQQPLLAVKIDLEQLIISILDDPSVSRVMREAGFSSTHVKSNVEQAVSSEMCSQSTPSSVISKAEESNFIEDLSHQSQPSLNLAGIQASKPKTLDPIRDEDIGNVIDNLMEKRRRSIVVVGERLSAIESVVQGVIDKILKGDVPEALREVKFLTFSGSYFRHLSRVEVEQKLEELAVHVRNYVGKGIVLNLGDLKWVTECRFSSSSDKRSPYFCPVEHMIMELGKLACRVGDNNGRIWLMGIATFQTYFKCKSRYPSLESLWDIHQITIPADSLSLSLITDSDLESQSTSRKAEKTSGWIILENDEEKQLTCCSDCTPKFEIETRSFRSSNTSRSDSKSSTLPVWLQQYQVESNFNSIDDDKDCVSIKDLCGRWNSICSSIHQRPSSSEKALTVASVSPSSSTSGFSYEQQCTNLHQNHLDWPMLEAKQSWRDHHFWISTDTNTSEGMIDPSLRLYIPEHKDHFKRLPFALDPKSAPNSNSSADVMEEEKLHQFKELNAENLKVLCNALQNKVPWQRAIIPEIASTILQCRSGMLRRKGKVRSKEAKEETWLLFEGVDVDAKEKIAKELAKLVFGSHSNYVSIPLSNFSSPRADSREDCRNKRSRDDHSCSFIERFAEAVSINPHRVFLLEDVEQADYCSQIGFKKAIESGRIVSSNGEEVGLSDAIAILSCESFSSRSRASSPINQKTDRSSKEDKVSGAFMDETSPFVSLDLNISIDDDRSAEDESIHDIGLVEYVDGQITFKIQQV
ncbi:hypothetical protein K2173_024160 [Erythroxylum novogranatense]|uniref:Clp R domain-containing protein n=1 Tax=Erythroxylum novogranatense TaxID=1862640 RepID=A0AAV8UC29_9ROSI|nr:hypothetical protein K2173_024160 [Erythroxylum novogranatense]